jgi:Cu(I)/Ag(I) efflux system protein CusF
LILWSKLMKKMTSMMIAASAIIALSSSAFAAVDDIALNKTGHEPAGAMGMAPAHATLSDAVVTALDPATGMITLRHGELKNVGMPAMTMAYKASDPAMLHQVTAGQNVKVRVENVDGTPTIVRLVAQ